MNLKKSAKIAWIPGILLIGMTTALAQVTVSLNWKEFAGAINNTNDGYGVVAANNWQNLTQVTTGSNVISSSGAATTVDFSTTSPAGWGTYFNAALDNTPMRAGVESFSTATGPDIVLSDLQGTFTSYDVIVYVTGFNAAAAGNQGSVTDGTSTFYYSVPNPYNGSLVQSTDTNIGDGADLGTYVLFSGLTADSTTISLRSPNNTGVAIGGIQVTGTAVPEPATFALLGGFLALGFVIVRRRMR